VGSEMCIRDSAKAITHDFSHMYSTGASEHQPHLNIDHTADPSSIDNYEDMQNYDEETHESPDFNVGVSKKSLYVHKPTGTKYLVKPYHGKMTGSMSHPPDGWGETVIGAMYKAGNIPHLIQQTHVTMGKVKGSDKKIPLLVIHMEPHAISASNMPYDSPTDSEKHDMGLDKMRINAMDYITGNRDRHGDNLMFRLGPYSGRPIHPIAIDNHWFKYDPSDMQILYSNAFNDVGMDHTMDEVHAPDFVDWWRDYSPFIRNTMQEHIVHIKDPDTGKRILSNFDDRCSKIDKMCDEYDATGDWKSSVHKHHY
jgi:hypothetical protein